MSLLNTTLQTAIVRLKDMSGNVTQQKLHNRIFDAYEAKALIFEAISPDQQAVMAQYNGNVPAQHPVGQPVLIENWSDLMKIHSDKNLYQLLPRRAKTNASYSTMRAICQSAGSPFSMDHRLDPIDFKFVFRAADFDDRNQYNAKCGADKVGPNIWYDGILSTPTDSGLVMCFPNASNKNLSETLGSVAFLKEWVDLKADGDRHRQMRLMYKKLLSVRTHIFCGSNTTPGRELLNFAKTKGIHIYAKKGDHFVFHS